MADNSDEFEYNSVRCFNIKVPKVGSAKAVLYDLVSLRECVNYIKRNRVTDAIVYILACRIGPFISYYKKVLEELGIKVFVNPDGHEWKRSKWNILIKKYWKYSEKIMVKNADLLVCDSKGIETYIRTKYRSFDPKTIHIAYGADVKPSLLKDEEQRIVSIYQKYKINPYEYYLIVGRFVPENNYEFMIKEFMASKSKKDLVIISNVEKNNFYQDLLKRTKFNNDSRIKFVGTVYNEQLLKKIRERAYGYLHGHEVGGTNPSLLEALASTQLNLLLDVVFNREVGADGVLYFTKEEGALTKLIEEVEQYSESNLQSLGHRAKQRIIEEYSWDKIVEEYERLFLSKGLC